MRYGLPIVLLLCLFTCQEESFEPLPFFGVQVSQVDCRSGVLGECQLFVNVSELSQADFGRCNNFRKGVYFSAVLEDVAGADAGAEQVIEAGRDSVDFVFVPEELEVGVTYYYRAFVECPPRRILSALDSFNIPFSLRIEALGDRYNDTLDVRLLAEGANLTSNEATYGIRLYDADTGDELADTLVNSLNVITSLVFPDFNVNYSLEPYVNDAGRQFAGQHLTVQVTDGWKRIADLPLALTRANMMVADGRVALFGGCDLFNCPAVGNVNVTNYALDLNTFIRPGSPAWSNNGNRDQPSFYNAGTLFDGRYLTLKGCRRIDTIVDATSRLEFLTVTGESEAKNINSELPDHNGTAFVIDGQIYYGLASEWLGGVFIERSDLLWRLQDLSATRPTFEVVGRLPFGREFGTVEAGGREDAFSVAYDSGVLIGGGRSSGATGDVWYAEVAAEDSLMFTRLADLPVPRFAAATINLAGRPFVGLGNRRTDEYLRDWYEYGDAGWVSREPFPLAGRTRVAAFSLPDGTGCICGGERKISAQRTFIYQDCWRYFPPTNE